LFYIICAFCYGGRDEEGIESATKTTGQDKSDILVLFRRVLGTPIYVSGIMFCYPENCDIWQPCGRGAGYHRF
jgi:hypothetical protein